MARPLAAPEQTWLTDMTPDAPPDRRNSAAPSSSPGVSSVPFGMTANELNAWIYHGGGQALWNELYAPFNLLPMLAVCLVSLTARADVAKQATHVDEVTGARTWQTRADGVYFSLTQILPDQLRAFYVNRGQALATFGAVLISGFWSVVNERFDPHTAKQVVGRIAAGATVGGLLGGVVRPLRGDGTNSGRFGQGVRRQDESRQAQRGPKSGYIQPLYCDEPADTPVL